MSYQLNYHSASETVEIELPYSKSEANRLLIAQALSKKEFEIEELSNAEDTVILQRALTSNQSEVNVGMAGTAFRFLTAYFAIQDGEEKTLTGAERMKKRPIGILVDQLRVLGAEIDYLEEEGYPPLCIKGKALKTAFLSIDASVSSQYITALLLIAPKLQDGLEIDLIGESVSLPYIDLTLLLQQKLGINAQRLGNKIVVKEGDYRSNQPLQVERDWSSAAFFYQWVALSKKTLRLKGLHEDSLQGDRACANIFKKLGVKTVYEKDGVVLHPIKVESPKELLFDLTDTPDLIPSIAVSASQLIKETTILGTQTLYIKESNRVEALQKELSKLGVNVEELDGERMKIYQSENRKDWPKNVSFSTYNDHRIAMSLAPLASLLEELSFDEINVVEKSFPHFWKELRKCGVNVS